MVIIGKPNQAVRPTLQPISLVWYGVILNPGSSRYRTLVIKGTSHKTLFFYPIMISFYLLVVTLEGMIFLTPYSSTIIVIQRSEIKLRLTSYF